MSQYHIGVDSTDSADLGMCTTYLGAVLIETLEGAGIKLHGYPEIVRLNPNVPWKTRGNGAVHLCVEWRPGKKKDLMELCSAVVEELSVFEDPQTNPGLAIIEGDVPAPLRSVYDSALHRILDLDTTVGIGKEAGASMQGWKNGRGLVGALAAVGADLSTAHTYECMLYRPGDVKGRRRDVDRSRLRASAGEFPSTFFNVDRKGKALCIPHSPCPVIMGIRGIDPGDVLRALSSVPAPGAERWVLWRTNQHTDVHMEQVEGLDQAIPYSSITTVVTVTERPVYGPGGHLHFEVTDLNGVTMRCYAYEPTKDFRKRLSPLREGDRLRVYAAVRVPSKDHAPSLNLEKVEVLSLAEGTVSMNPRCPDCGGPTESMGRGQALRCKRCRKRLPGLQRSLQPVERGASVGPIEPPPVAWRHLYKPVSLPSVEERPWDGPVWGRGHP